MPFCVACGAPQIKVTLPAAAQANQPLTEPLPPGTPDSIQPAALPLQLLPTGQIQWKHFWRIALPLSIISGMTIALFGILGVILFVVSIVVSIRRYRNEHAGPLVASHGMRLGAASGLLSYLVVLVFVIARVASDFGEFQREWLLNMQQRINSNADPQVQQIAHWAASHQGMIVLIPVSAMLGLVLVLLFSGVIGALAAAFSREERHGG